MIKNTEDWLKELEKEIKTNKVITTKVNEKKSYGMSDMALLKNKTFINKMILTNCR